MLSAARSLWLVHALFVWGLFCAPTWAAEKTALKRFTLPGHGFLELQVPRNWLEIVRQPVDQGPPTIVFGPLQGLQFEISLTPSWQTDFDKAGSGEKAIRQQVERLVEDIRSNAVEKDLGIASFKGNSGSGFYFSATDKSPKPMDYKFVTQGILNVARLSVSFTVLTHEGQADVVAAALAMLRNARYSPPAPSAR